MEVWTMCFFKQQCCNKHHEEGQGKQTPKGTREITLYIFRCVYDVLIPVFMYAVDAPCIYGEVYSNSTPLMH